MKVICIDDSNSWGELVVGEVCEVEKEYPGVYKIVNGGQWNKNRFEIVEEDEGMLKTCDNCGHGINTLCSRPAGTKCIGREDWIPRICKKEPVAEEKGTVSTWEMVKALTENPKRTARSANSEKNILIKIGRSNNILMELNGLDFSTDDQWQIIEPPKQLKKMTFGEAFKYYKQFKYIKSIETGVEAFRNAGCDDITVIELSDKEIDGLFTVEGVYEDET